MRASGRGLRRLTASANDRHPSFSPDGQRVAFLRDFTSVGERRTEWHTIDIDGRNDVLVAAAGSSVPFRYGAPQWTPDGKRLAAVREQSIPWASSRRMSMRS